MGSVRWTVSRRAVRDLADIRNHTVTRWGAAQARVYLREINAAIERVASNPSLRKSCEEELPGYFRAIVGSHIVFYREIDDGIRVERVLHQRMDFEAHL